MDLPPRVTAEPPEADRPEHPQETWGKPSMSWTSKFLAIGGISYKEPGGNPLTTHPSDTQLKDLRTTLASVRLAVKLNTDCSSWIWLVFTGARSYLPEHIHIIFIAPGSTGYLQPLDRAVFQSWKSRVSQEANEMMASFALEGDQPLTESFNLSKPFLKEHTARC
eukprot:6482283-Amphidinium_carterae.2